MFTPPEHGSRKVLGGKKCGQFPCKPGFLCGASVKITPINPAIQFQNRAPPLKWCPKGKRASYAPSPLLLSLCVCIFPPVPDFGLRPVKTRPKTGLSCPPESDAPRSFLFAPPPFPQPTCSCSVHVLRFSLFLSHPPPPSPYVGLITWWYRISGFTPSLACAKARWVLF